MVVPNFVLQPRGRGFSEGGVCVRNLKCLKETVRLKVRRGGLPERAYLLLARPNDE